jgi:hypothetical protein
MMISMQSEPWSYSALGIYKPARDQPLTEALSDLVDLEVAHP